MTTASDQEPRATEHGAGSTVSCPRCQRESPSGTLECPGCGRHFFVHCSACGQLNPRAAIRCKACTHQLRVRRHSRRWPAIHRLVWPRRWDWRHKPRWVLPAQILVSLLAVFLGAQAILFLHAKLAMPSRRGAEEVSRLYVMPDGKIVELPPDSAFGKSTTP